MDFAINFSYDFSFILVMLFSCLAGGYLGKKIYENKRKFLALFQNIKQFLHGCLTHPWDGFNVVCEALRLVATLLMVAGSAASLLILGSLQSDYLEYQMNSEATLCGLSIVIGLIFFSVQCSWLQVSWDFTVKEFNLLLSKIYTEDTEVQDPWAE